LNQIGRKKREINTIQLRTLKSRSVSRRYMVAMYVQGFEIPSLSVGPSIFDIYFIPVRFRGDLLRRKLPFPYSRRFIVARDNALYECTETRDKSKKEKT
jgi:hypothetical protein